MSKITEILNKTNESSDNYFSKQISDIEESLLDLKQEAITKMESDSKITEGKINIVRKSFDSTLLQIENLIKTVEKYS